MTSENIRVNELAKELNLTNKEVLEKIAKLSIPVKTHSSSVTPDQVKKLKVLILKVLKCMKIEKSLTKIKF